MIETTSTIPKKMEKMLITFSDKFGWCKYTELTKVDKLLSLTVIEYNESPHRL